MLGVIRQKGLGYWGNILRVMPLASRVRREIFLRIGIFAAKRAAVPRIRIILVALPKRKHKRAKPRPHRPL